MKLTIALASLAAFTYVGSQFCYAEELLDTVLNTALVMFINRYQTASLMLILLIAVPEH